MKRHLLTIGGGLTGIVLTVALLLSGASVIQKRQGAETQDFTLETPDVADVPDLGGDDMSTGDKPVDSSEPALENPAGSGAVNATGESESKSVRDIAPEQFGLPQEVTSQPLERIEPRTPLSPSIAKPESAPAVLRHPVALSAGLIQFGDRLLQLDGIVPQTTDRMCGEAGKTWPCGVIARTALRNFIRSRALLCNVPEKGWQGTLTTSCSLNNIDPAAWLAERGWAEVPAGSALADKMEAAQKSRLGFFGDDPRTFSIYPAPREEKTVPGSVDTDASTLEQGL
jgi:hypothetical protein